MELKSRVAKETQDNPLLKKSGSPAIRHNKDRSSGEHEKDNKEREKEKENKKKTKLKDRKVRCYHLLTGFISCLITTNVLHFKSTVTAVRAG